MTIHADQFFPCTQKQFRKLLKVIRQFSHLNNVQEIAEQIKSAIIMRVDGGGYRITGREISALRKCLEMLGSLKV